MSREYKCSVPNCPTKASSGFFRLPEKDLDLRAKWCDLLQLNTDRKTQFICHLHFRDEDIGDSGTKRRQNVLPSRNLPVRFDIFKKKKHCVFQSFVPFFPLNFEKFAYQFQFSNSPKRAFVQFFENSYNQIAFLT